MLLDGRKPWAPNDLGSGLIAAERPGKRYRDPIAVKPPIPEEMGFQPSGPLSGALAGQACYNIPGLATVLSWFSSDAP